MSNANLYTSGTKEWQDLNVDSITTTKLVSTSEILVTDQIRVEGNDPLNFDDNTGNPLISTEGLSGEIRFATWTADAAPIDFIFQNPNIVNDDWIIQWNFFRIDVSTATPLPAPIFVTRGEYDPTISATQMAFISSLATTTNVICKWVLILQEVSF